jgi:hypothetical protein
MAAPAESKRFQSWPASILLFTIATAGEFGALVGWYLLHMAQRPFLASLALIAGFIVERYVVVLWLHVPRRVITPAGNLRSLLVVLIGVTVAEMTTWTVWIGLAEAGEPWFAAAFLATGIHLVHSYEVALLKHSELRPTIIDRGVITITLLESVGGVWALWLAGRGHDLFPLFVLGGALLTEHIVQVLGLKKSAAPAVTFTVVHATHH